MEMEREREGGREGGREGVGHTKEARRSQDQARLGYEGACFRGHTVSPRTEVRAGGPVVVWISLYRSLFSLRECASSNKNPSTIIKLSGRGHVFRAKKARHKSAPPPLSVRHSAVTHYCRSEPSCLGMRFICHLFFPPSDALHLQHEVRLYDPERRLVRGPQFCWAVPACDQYGRHWVRQSQRQSYGDGWCVVLLH
jgi:hypothetical protein